MITAAEYAALPDKERRRFKKKYLDPLSDEAKFKLLYTWEFWARPNQLLPEGEWDTWMPLAGRGWGKTRTGAESVRRWVEESERPIRVALVGATARDVRRVMVEGESGLLNVCPPWNYPRYEPANLQLVWPNGSIAFMYSAEEPGRLNGPQHHKAWADELGVWRYGEEARDMLLFGLRLGDQPQELVTTTPKGAKTVRSIVKDAERNPDRVLITRGSTYENAAHLAGPAIRRFREKYEGTRIGRQELYAEILEEAEGALWRRDWIEKNRVRADVVPELKRVVVAIDPSVTSTEESDEVGIGAAGLGVDDRGYVLDDVSDILSPDAWARRAINLYKTRKADRIVGEVNNGGDLIEFTLRTIDKNVPYKKLHASRGKQARAEPIAALYEQNRVSHVGTFAMMEDEMCQWEPLSGMRSPNRLDMVVWALTELMITPGERKQTKLTGY